MNLKTNLGFTPPCDACGDVNAKFHSNIENDKGKGEAAYRELKSLQEYLGGFRGTTVLRRRNRLSA